MKATNSRILSLSETILLTCLLFETGISIEQVVIEIDAAAPGSPISLLAKKIRKPMSISELGDQLLIATKNAKCDQEKAFFSLIATACFSGMTIGKELRWMADVFREPCELTASEILARNNFLRQMIKPLADRTGLDLNAWDTYVGAVSAQILA